MIHYDYYADVPDGAIEDLLRASRLGRLVTAGTSSEFPHLGLYPFTHNDGPSFIEIHLHRKDEQIADLRERATCVFEVDEVMSTIPSHWIDEENAVFATAYHRTVAFECAATLVEDPAAIAIQQNKIMARYQPERRHREVKADDPMYTSMLRMLVGIRLDIRKAKVKFKLGQNRDFETRTSLINHLRERGTDIDKRTADILQWTIDVGWTSKGRAK